MKKLAPIMITLLLLVVPMNAYASTRQVRITPSITFDGTIANCKVFITADNMADSIQVSVKLMQGVPALLLGMILEVDSLILVLQKTLQKEKSIL